ALSHRFLRVADLRKACTGPLDASNDLTSDAVPLPTSVMRHHRPRMEDDHDNLVIYNGTLYKLGSGMNAEDKKAWDRRDVWISAHGHLGYFSQKERLRSQPAHQLSVAVIERFAGRTAMEHAMEMPRRCQTTRTQARASMSAGSSPATRGRTWIDGWICSTESGTRRWRP
ncbi:unnamed protein product, partial [Prorocentrum cordatum]